MKRDPSIELFRVLMMFGIVLLHVCQMTPGHWPNNVLVSCVSGFVLISGYFYAVGSAVESVFPADHEGVGFLFLVGVESDAGLMLSFRHRKILDSEETDPQII